MLSSFSLRRIVSVVALAIFAAVAGAATAKVPDAAVSVAAGLFGVLLLGIMLRTVVERNSPEVRTDPPSLVPVILLCYLLPMFFLSRSFALVGVNPIYLPDVLATLAAGFAMGRAQWRRLELYAATSGLIAVLMAHAVLVGRHDRYPDAIKGLVLVIYPVIAVPIAGWISQRLDIERLLSFLPRLVFPLIPIGLILTHGHHEVPSAYGLELGIAGSFAIVAGMPARKLLMVSFLAGAVIFFLYSAKRGPALTLFLSCGAAWVASRRLHLMSKKMLVGIGAASLVVLFGISVVSGFVVLPQSTPVIGKLAARASGNQSASDNVAIREVMWNYALTTTWNDDPFLGVGAYHPIDITFKRNDIADKPNVGVHNSFIGYTFYAGFLEGGLVALVFLWALVRTWRVRRLSVYAPAIFGALIAVIATAMTNVSFEVTYMGGPSWLVVALAFGLSAKLINDAHSDDDNEDDDLALPEASALAT